MLKNVKIEIKIDIRAFCMLFFIRGKNNNIKNNQFNFVAVVKAIHTPVKI